MEPWLPFLRHPYAPAMPPTLQKSDMVAKMKCLRERGFIYYGLGYYDAYIRDPDDNKLHITHRGDIPSAAYPLAQRELQNFSTLELRQTIRNMQRFPHRHEIRSAPERCDVVAASPTSSEGRVPNLSVHHHCRREY